MTIRCYECEISSSFGDMNLAAAYGWQEIEFDPDDDGIEYSGVCPDCFDDDFSDDDEDDEL